MPPARRRGTVARLRTISSTPIQWRAQPPPPRHPSPPRPVHRPTRPHHTPPLGRCGGLRSLSRGGVTRPGSAGRGSARRASAPCGGSTTSSCARCPAAPPNPHPTPPLHASLHPCLSTESSSTQVLCWTDFRTRSAAHCASKVLGLGLGLGSGQLGFATVPMPPSPAIHGPGGAWGLGSASTSPLGCRGEATHGPGGADDALRSAS